MTNLSKISPISKWSHSEWNQFMSNVQRQATQRTYTVNTFYVPLRAALAQELRGRLL